MINVETGVAYQYNYILKGLNYNCYHILKKISIIIFRFFFFINKKKFLMLTFTLIRKKGSYNNMIKKKKTLTFLYLTLFIIFHSDFCSNINNNNKTFDDKK